MGFNSLRFLYLLCFLLLSNVVFAQNNAATYQLNIKKLNEIVRLDGILDEPFWEDIETASDFWMNFPVGGTLVDNEFQTSVKIAYDDDFIYLGVECYGEGPFLVQSPRKGTMIHFGMEMRLQLF